jgi:hypothetical protein
MSRNHTWYQGAGPRPGEAPRPQAGSSSGELVQRAQKASVAPTATKDDSGVIDLHALMAAAQAMAAAESQRPAASGDERTPVPVVRNLAVYPFGAPPALDSAPPPAQPAPRGFSRRGTVMMVLGGVALGGAVAAVVLARASHPGEEPARAPASAGDTAALTAETARLPGPPQDVDTTSPGREPTSPAKSAAPVEPVLPAKSAGPRVVGPVVKAPVVKTPVVKTPAVATGKPASPAADPCNGDLLCAMKRATEKR